MTDPCDTLLAHAKVIADMMHGAEPNTEADRDRQREALAAAHLSLVAQEAAWRRGSSPAPASGLVDALAPFKRCLERVDHYASPRDGAHLEAVAGSCGYELHNIDTDLHEGDADDLLKLAHIRALVDTAKLFGLA